MLNFERQNSVELEKLCYGFRKLNYASGKSSNTPIYLRQRLKPIDNSLSDAQKLP